MELIDYFKIIEFGVIGIWLIYMILERRRDRKIIIAKDRHIKEKDEYIKALEKSKEEIQDDRINDVKDQLNTINALRETITLLKTEMGAKLNALRDIIIQRGNG